MRTRRRIDGEWTYFVIEDLPEAYQGWHGIADQLGLYLHFMPQSIDSYGTVVPTASAHLDDAYDNFQRSLDDLFRQTARGGWAMIAGERRIGTVKDAAAPFDAGAQEGAREGIVSPVRHGSNRLNEAVE